MQALSAPPRVLIVSQPEQWVFPSPERLGLLQRTCLHRCPGASESVHVEPLSEFCEELADVDQEGELVGGILVGPWCEPHLVHVWIVWCLLTPFRTIHS